MTPPAEVLAAWGFSAGEGLDGASFVGLSPITVGLINTTFRVELVGRRCVLQRLHPIFAPSVNLDIEAVTTHLAARGVMTPRLVRTREGAAFVLDHEGRCWRALTFIEGVCRTELTSPSQVRSAGALAGRFATATLDLQHEFAFARHGVHDTPQHLTTLTAALASADGDVMNLGETILEFARGLPVIPELPRRVVHGDLKASNLLFDGDEACCLLDLDTLGWGTVATEMGDALRSWTSRRGEDAQGSVDLELFRAAVDGYVSATGSWLTPDERLSLVPGLETIALELAARFCTDAVHDRYFGWDATKFPSRRAHNIARAWSQLALARSVRSQRGELEECVARGWDCGGAREVRYGRS